MEYRKDIDGLRAVAVLAVLFYHFEYQFMRGGFVGVDVFFVISGYLISGIIKNQIEAGRFSIGNFYARRARRLLPAFIVVSVLTYFLSYKFFAIDLFQDISASFTHAMFSLSNIYFYVTSGYFADGAEVKPFLHTWSLAVEEQFYLVWPFVLVWLLHKTTKVKIIVSVLFVALVSLAGSQFLAAEGSEAPFFLTPLRFFEFACGILVLYIPNKTFRWKYWDDLICIAGLALIGYACYRFSDETVFPGTAALIPCLGTSLLLWRGGNSSLIGGFGLSNKVMVYVGKISYSLYLVHWPAYVLLKYYKFDDLHPANQRSLFAISFAAAALIYHLVENPIRQKRLFKRLTGAQFGLACMAVLAGLTIVSANFWGEGGLIEREVSPHQERIGYLNQQWRDTKRISKWGKCVIPGSANYDPAGCMSVSDTKPNILLLGDSFAFSMYPGFISQMPEANFNLASVFSCRPILRPTTRRPACKARNKYIYEELDLSIYDAVILTGGFKFIKNTKGVEEVAKIISAQGPKVYLLGPMFTYWKKVVHILQRFPNLSAEDIKDNVLPRFTKEEQFTAEQFFKDQRSPHYTYVSIIDLFCEDGKREKCQHFLPGTDKFLFKDRGHVTVDASKWIVGQLLGQGYFKAPASESSQKLDLEKKG